MEIHEAENYITKYPQAISEIIRAVVLRPGMTNSSVARIIGCTEGTVRNIVAGKTIRQLAIRKSFCRSFAKEISEHAQHNTACRKLERKEPIIQETMELARSVGRPLTREEAELLAFTNVHFFHRDKPPEQITPEAIELILNLCRLMEKRQDRQPKTEGSDPLESDL